MAKAARDIDFKTPISMSFILTTPSLGLPSILAVFRSSIRASVTANFATVDPTEVDIRGGGNLPVRLRVYYHNDSDVKF
jgi:hypothetical protein